MRIWLLAVILAVLAAAADGGAPDAGPHEALAEKRAPAALLRYLRQKTVGETCSAERWTEPAPLEISQTLDLKSGALLFFAQVPDYQCDSSNSAVPVVASPEGELKWGAPVPGRVTHLLRAEDGSFWAVSQWQVEGTYPMLLHSGDGLSFKDIPLPNPRITAGPSELLQAFCIVQGRLLMRFQDPDGPTEAVYSRDALGGGGFTRETGVFTGCLEPQALRRWRRDDSPKDRTVLRSEHAVVSLPKRLRPH